MAEEELGYNWLKIKVFSASELYLCYSLIQYIHFITPFINIHLAIATWILTIRVLKEQSNVGINKVSRLIWDSAGINTLIVGRHPRARHVHLKWTRVVDVATNYGKWVTQSEGNVSPTRSNQVTNVSLFRSRETCEARNVIHSYSWDDAIIWENLVAWVYIDSSTCGRYNYIINVKHRCNNLSVMVPITNYVMSLYLVTVI